MIKIDDGQIYVYLQNIKFIYENKMVITINYKIFYYFF